MPGGLLGPQASLPPNNALDCLVPIPREGKLPVYPGPGPPNPTSRLLSWPQGWTWVGWIENKPRGCLCSFLPIVLAHLIPDLGWGSKGEWSTGSVLMACPEYAICSRCKPQGPSSDSSTSRYHQHPSGTGCGLGDTAEEPHPNLLPRLLQTSG